ncbi:MAG: hypothetical protein ACK4MF_10410 [Hyphomicrobiaceae bacterium]
MTFCVAARVGEGIVALADTRIVRGSERLSKSKLSLHELETGGSYFVMTSGLRSIRDKLVIYADEELARGGLGEPRLYRVANLVGEQLRRVRAEDGAGLAAGGLSFNLHAIVGGRLSKDALPTLFLVYPEGNWIEVTDDTPYFVIGRTPYSLALLDRHLKRARSLRDAATLSLLAFEVTASSVTDVDYPIDMAVMRAEATSIRKKRYDREELKAFVANWEAAVDEQIRALPADWLRPLLDD